MNRIQIHHNRIESLLNHDTRDHNRLRLKNGYVVLLHRTCSDYVQTNGDTEDKLNFTKINGFPGLRTNMWEKPSKYRKAAMDKDQPIDVYYTV
jgi:hypothetical protein